METKSYKTLYWIFGAILLILIIGISCYFWGRNSVEIIENTTTKIDTVTKRDTITYNNITPKYIVNTKVIKDTLYTTDTIPQLVEVNVPIEQKTYQDSDFYAVISGFKANLDTLKVYPKETTITIEKTITKEKKPQIAIMPNIGVGYGFFNKKPDVFVGLSIGIPIWSK